MKENNRKSKLSILINLVSLLLLILTILLTGVNFRTYYYLKFDYTQCFTIDFNIINIDIGWINLYKHLIFLLIAVLITVYFISLLIVIMKNYNAKMRIALLILSILSMIIHKIVSSTLGISTENGSYFGMAAGFISFVTVNIILLNIWIVIFKRKTILKSMPKAAIVSMVLMTIFIFHMITTYEMEGVILKDTSNLPPFSNKLLLFSDMKIGEDGKVKLVANFEDTHEKTILYASKIAIDTLKQFEMEDSLNSIGVSFNKSLFFKSRYKIVEISRDNYPERPFYRYTNMFYEESNDIKY